MTVKQAVSMVNRSVTFVAISRTSSHKLRGWRVVGAFGQEPFDIAEAEREREVQPNCVRDQFGWEAVAVMGIGLASHLATMPSAPTTRQPRSLCDDVTGQYAPVPAVPWTTDGQLRILCNIRNLHDGWELSHDRPSG